MALYIVCYDLSPQGDYRGLAKAIEELDGIRFMNSASLVMAPDDSASQIHDRLIAHVLPTDKLSVLQLDKGKKPSMYSKEMNEHFAKAQAIAEKETHELLARFTRRTSE
ncbi:hypothetical protein [Burkholderia gladioli]|uniref:hypothetical protein n=1 Tax=Burkholderia gladioli TaxID=28095 RepID=UPI001640C2C5|nr:hypothetical protein [Burkholderia gladioli]